MGSDNKNTDKNKETRSKLEQEIYDALNSEPEFEETPNPELSPLNEPVEKIPAFKRKAYFKELCNWLTNGYQQFFHKTYTKRDYLIRYAIFPPEQVPEPGDIQKTKLEAHFRSDVEAKTRTSQRPDVYPILPIPRFFDLHVGGHK